jgi:hypothetical protein
MLSPLCEAVACKSVGGSAKEVEASWSTRHRPDHHPYADQQSQAKAEQNKQDRAVAKTF